MHFSTALGPTGRRVAKMLALCAFVGATQWSPALAAAPAAGTSAVAPTPNEPSPSGTSSADGLLPNFVSGTITSVRPGSLLISVPGRLDPVTVLVDASTQIDAGPFDGYGSTATCRPGDRVDVGTTQNRSGARTARWLVTNPTQAYVQVESATADRVVGREFDRDQHWTGHTITAQAPTGTTPATLLSGPVTVGDYYVLEGTGATPAEQPDSFWVIGGSRIGLGRPPTGRPARTTG